MRKVLLIVLDSVGVGAMPDAPEYLDTGANTLANTAIAAGGLDLPTLQRWGIGNITSVPGVPPADSPVAAFGRMAEASPAKDTVTGHWELAGLVSTRPFTVYADGFPTDFVAAFETRTGHKTIVNKPYSGTEILADFGQEHLKTGELIIYTSADSVFQIAAHEEKVPLEELYRVCRIAREMLDEFHVARVIARPFVGRPGAFQRTYNRKDFCMEPPAPTLLDRLTEAGIPVWGIGKIEDIFAGRGVARNVHTEGNIDGFEQTLRLMQEMTGGLLFANLVDFDMVYGHRRNATGYAQALEEADGYLAQIAGQLGPEDVMVITADHGCDPTHVAHTDHTREYVPILVIGPRIPALDLGTRSSFADLAASISNWLGLPPTSHGNPFLPVAEWK